MENVNLKNTEAHLPRIPVTIVQATDANDQRIPQAIDILIEAFRGDAADQSMSGGREELRRSMYTCLVHSTVIGGALYFALNESSEVVGVAAVFPPGTDFGADEKQQAGITAFFQELQREAPELYEWWTLKLMKDGVTEIPEKAFKAAGFTEDNFKKNNFNMYSFAVKPEVQRRGIGGKLLKSIEDQASIQGFSVCLEAGDHMVEMYTSLGYSNIGSGSLDGSPGFAPFTTNIFVKALGI